MPLINYKIHLELNWIEDCILSNDGDSEKSKLTDARLHVPIVTLSIKDNENSSKQSTDGFKRSAYWDSYQAIPAKVIEKGKNIFDLLCASFQGVKRLFVLTYGIAANAADNEGGIKYNKIIFFQAESKKYNVLIDERNFYDQPISDLIIQYDKVRKVSSGQSADYTTACLFDYAYFKDNYRLISDDLSKQKIQQIVFQGVVGGADWTKIRMYTILQKSKETVLEFCKGTAISANSINGWYNKVNVKLSNSQLNKLISAVKNQTGLTLRIAFKMFNENNLPRELLLTTRQKTKLKAAFENNMSTDIKLPWAQISKIIQSGKLLGSLLSKIAGSLMKLAVPLAKKVLAPLGIATAALTIDAEIQKKIHGSGTTLTKFKWRSEWSNENYSSSWGF